MTHKNRRYIAAPLFGLLLLLTLSFSAQAHRGNWYITGEDDFAQYFSPIYLGYHYIQDPSYLVTGLPQGSPLHISFPHSDYSLDNIHVTFGTDSFNGNNSNYPRYAYYPRQDMWRLVGRDGEPSYRSNWLNFQEFQRQVREEIVNIEYLLDNSSANPEDSVRFQRMIDDANEAIGTTGTLEGSVLVRWYNDFNTLVPTSPPPAGPTAVGSSTAGAVPVPTPTEVNAGVLTGLAIIASTFLGAL